MYLLLEWQNHGKVLLGGYFTNGTWFWNNDKPVNASLILSKDTKDGDSLQMLDEKRNFGLAAYNGTFRFRVYICERKPFIDYGSSQAELIF